MIKKNQMEEMTSLKSLQNEVWKIFDLKNQANLGIGSDEFYIVLYFLLLQKEGVLAQHCNMTNAELRESLNNIKEEFDGDKFVFFELLQDEFSPIINRLNYYGI